MNDQLIQHIEQYPVIPVFYHDDVEVCKQILKTVYEGGIQVFEFVHRGSAAEKNFKELLAFKATRFPDMKLGIGTIMNADLANTYINLGAEFLVSPIFSEPIAEIANKNNILWIPGCMTPSEIAQAQHAQCAFIKLFPGDSLGPNFLKSIKTVFPNLKFMPTGGVEVSESNIKEWFNAGVSSVGLGSKLFVKSNDEYNYAAIRENCSKLLKWAKNS
ncbi:bifunctional 4-hydroxy-2-oxoglutarate aldolase/2-dehydro-3-deoxy-phosphogluconate aldolase [Sphingobacterium sp. HJSM2_6]|uniref:bifunctional 4-hydroxy-2-oxoglutarate aldolase/2-dehydro-3-deoxy-phosphogluconate aldolase n=1 Tax=Sphingobacterium sp. HJSM2_6 TaxID=3366264 RepID=UPI003BDBF725